VIYNNYTYVHFSDISFSLLKMFKYLIFLNTEPDQKLKIEVDSKTIIRNAIQKTLNLCEEFTIECYDEEFKDYYIVKDYNFPDSCRLKITLKDRLFL